MNCYRHDRASFFSRAWKSIALIGFILCCLSITSYSQNAKGDKPVNNKGKVREARFKSRSKQGDKARVRDVAGRRLRTKNKSSANRAVVKYKQPKAAKARERAGGSDRVGRPLTPTYGGTRPRDVQTPGKGRRVHVRSATGRSRNVFPQFGQYTHNPSRKPRNVQRPASNRPELARLKRMQSSPPDGGRKKRTVIPRSASRSFIAHKSINPIARFKRKTTKGERAVTRDLAGRKLRAKNFETKRPPVVSPSFNPYYGRKRVGDRPYSGPAAGGHISATKPNPKAWKGDLAGRKIRGRNYSSKPKTTAGAPLFGFRAPKPRYGDKIFHGKRKGVGYKSATKAGEKLKGKASLPVRPPGIGADRIGKYSGNIKARKPLKGGGSVSGKLWNNKQTPVTVKPPGEGTVRAGRFQGNLKGHKPEKGGGSVSGKLWNNKQSPIPARPPSSDTQRAGRFQGNIKAHRPDKGGGSVSGKLWNNKQSPMPVRPPSSDTQRAGRFQGNLKAHRPGKGGGSVSGKLWNNKQSPIPVRPPSSDTQRAGRFQGNIKAHRPEKGGGSVSGKLWNNKESPIPVRPPSSDTQRAGRFQGNIKARRPEKGGGSVSGKLWNNKESPIPVKPPSSETERASRHRGNYQLFELSPDMRDQGEEFTGTIRLKRFRKNYVKNPNAADGALKKARPDKSTFQVDDLQAKTKQYHFVKNPSSAKAALKVREPGKAFGRETDYQGNIKMKKFDLFAKNKRDLHPDAKFVKLNKNNVPAERDLLTNFKLWWARLFKKNDTQPDNVKEKDKEHRPRYDKGEQGLWYD